MSRRGGGRASRSRTRREPERADRPLEGASARLHAGAIAAVFLALAVASWGRWADPFIDFGREIYVAWRLAAGQVLYRDLAYFHGPLSPHFNAALLRGFGTSIWTLFGVNLVLLGALAAMVARGLEGLYGRLAATLATIFLLGAFGFAQQLTVAGFNFVGPYSHEMTHGSLLAVVALGGLFAWLRDGRPRAAAGTGAACGLLLLGKPEFALAVLGAVVVGVVVAAWTRRRSAREVARMAAASLLGAALPVATAWLALGRELGAGAAGRALVSPWVYLANSEVRDLAFYRQGIGLDRPLANVASAGLWATGIVAALAIGVVLARRRWAGRGLAGPVFLVLPGTLLFLLRDHLHWTSFARPLPYVLAVAIAIQLRALARARAAGEPAEPRAIARLAATAYALLLLLKMALNTRLHQYGFALALPGSLLVVAWLVGVAPERWCAPPGRRRLRQWVVSLVLGVLAVQVGISARVWRGQGTKLDLGADSLVADAQASFHRLIAERLRTRMPARATLVVVPEGVMVNYLNRRVNPTPFVNFMPPELLLFGEERILAALRRAPPDFVLLTNRDAADYGMGMLGRDHGRDLMRWIEGSYETVDEIREPSSAGLYFSYGLLLRRRGLGP